MALRRRTPFGRVGSPGISTGIAVDIMTDRSCIPAIAKSHKPANCG